MCCPPSHLECGTHWQPLATNIPPPLAPPPPPASLPACSGALGRGSTSSPALYRSYFPTILARWWKEVRYGKQLCLDACPLPSCLPYSAKKIAHLTPNAKLIFMLRDPVAGAFSAELMASFHFFAVHISTE